MAFAVAIFTGLLVLVITNGFTPAKPAKTSEEELGDAIAKYLSTSNKAGGEQKDARK